MNKITRVKKVTRVQNKTIAGTVYYPRIEFSGSDLEQLGLKFGDLIKIVIDVDNQQIIIEKFQ
jgi:hypothetical protein